MSHPESSLPDAWVERIWVCMRASYGASFDRQWECPAGVDPGKHVRDMKAHWGRELRGFQQNPNAIGHALDNLPEQPPNLVQFKLLCQRRPDPNTFRLTGPEPEPDPARTKEMFAKVQNAWKERHPRQWIRDLEARKSGGEQLSAGQRSALEAARGEEVEPLMQFQNVDRNSLPPGMR